MIRLLPGLALVVMFTSACFAPVDDMASSSSSAPGDASFAPFPQETSTGLTMSNVDCGTHGVRLDPGTMAQDKQRLLGVWVRCTNPLPQWAGGSPMAAEFLEVRDGSWHRLERQPDGTLTRRIDLDGSGLVRFVDVSAMNSDRQSLQADFQGVGGGWFLTQPRFEASPDRVRFTVYPSDVIDFARVR